LRYCHQRLLDALMPLAPADEASADVCFWHKADMPQRESNVRFWGKADIDGRVTSANSVEFDPKRTLARSDRANYSFSKASGAVRLCKLAAYSRIAMEQET